MRRRPNNHIQEAVALTFDFPISSTAFSPGVKAIKILTFPAKASITDETLLTIRDGLGAVHVLGLDVAGDGVSGDDVTVDISSGSSAASVAALVYTELVALGQAWDFVDNLNGTITATHQYQGTFGNVSWDVTTDPDITVSLDRTGTDPTFGETVADTTSKLFKAPRDMVIDGVDLLSLSGLAEDVSNFFNVKILNDALVAANWSTETGEEGSIPANQFVSLTLGSLANRSVASGDVISVSFDETGVATLPPGRITIHGRYV